MEKELITDERESKIMVMNNEGKYGGYIVQELKEPAHFTDESRARYERFAKRILYMDTNVVPGAFQMNTSWYHSDTPIDKTSAAHMHDVPEIIGYYGSDPDDPYELYAEVEFSIEGEIHLLTKSTMIFIPPGIMHQPLAVMKISRPVFHFSICTSPEYSYSHTS